MEGLDDDVDVPEPRQKRDIIDFNIEHPNIFTTYYQYDVLKALQYGVTPVIVILGIFSNLLILAVCLQKSFRKSVFSIGVIALALIDTNMLIQYSIYELIPIFMMLLEKSTKNLNLTIRGSDIKCQIVTFAGNVSQIISPWTIVFIGIERAIAIYQPLKAKFLLTERRVRLGLVALFLIIASSQAWTFFLVESTYENGVYTCTTNTIDAEILYFCNITFLSCFGPFGAMFATNIAIIAKLYRQAKVRKLMNKTQSSSDRRERANAVMLIALSMTYFFLTLPVATVTLLEKFSPQIFEAETRYETSLNHILHLYIANLLYYSNSAINLVLYTITGENFRKSAVEFFLGIKRSICKQK